jgi:hypothetical protein
MIYACLGVQRIVQIGTEINIACGCKRIQFIDIGGGLSVNYKSDEITPSMSTYAHALCTNSPELFNSEILGKIKIITEFGKALIAKCGVIVTLVEDIMIHKSTPLLNSVITDKTGIFKKISNIFNSKEKTEKSGNLNDVKGGMTAIVHAGADLLLRTAYCPEKFIHRVVLLNSSSDLLQISETVEKKIDVDDNRSKSEINGIVLEDENSKETYLNDNIEGCSSSR